MIRLRFRSTPRGVDRIKLRTASRIAYKFTGLRVSGEIHVDFVSKLQSKRLNQQFAGNSYATDVLSFPYREQVADSVVIGDIAICTAIARQAASTHNISLQDEITLLLVHGVLHLLGFDHHDSIERSSFDDLQNAIMKELQIKTHNYLYDYT